MAILADEPRPFADRTLELLQDPDLQERLVKAASEFVMAYDWSAIVPRLEAAYAKVRET
jgi:glycosyltransferase involved in cell wall biosynthesis